MAISEPGSLLAGQNRIPCAVTFGRSSIHGTALAPPAIGPSASPSGPPTRFTSRSTSRTGPRSSPPSPAPSSFSTSIPSPRPPPPPPPLSPPPPHNFSELHALAIGATRTLISAAIECGVRRVVYTASAAVAFDGPSDVVLGDESVPYPDKYEDALDELRAARRWR